MFQILRFSKPLYLFFLGGLLCGFLKAPAQVFISKDPSYLRVKTESDNLASAYRQVYPDTTVTNLNNFFPRNFMGNPGLPSPAYFFTYGADEAGYRFFNPPTINDRITASQVEYYRSKGPYAELTGIAGGKLLQAFKMLFTHTYKEKINITLRFNRYSSQGFYLRQQTYANNFFASSNFTAKNKRAGYYAYVLNNGNKNQENGGIKAGILTDSTQNLNKALFPVRLTGANRDNRETKAMINPWLRLNKVHDSLYGFNHYLQLKSKGGLYAYKYRDTKIYEDQFYNLVNTDTALTLDSSHVKQLSNELDYTLLSADDKYAASLGYKNEITEVWQYNNHFYQNHIVVANLAYRSAMRAQDSSSNRECAFEALFNAQYVAAGANSGNYRVEGNALYSFNSLKKRNFYLNLLFEKRNPDRIYNDCYSNHFVWSNNAFQAQEQFQAKTGINFSKVFNASLLYQNVYNYLYFDEIAYPRQYKKTINNTALALNYNEVFF